jgi:hypothetical protein
VSSRETVRFWVENPKCLFRILAITSPLFLIPPSTIIHNNIIYVIYYITQNQLRTSKKFSLLWCSLKHTLFFKPYYEIEYPSVFKYVVILKGISGKDVFYNTLTTLSDECPSCFTIKNWGVAFKWIKKIKRSREVKDRFLYIDNRQRRCCRWLNFRRSKNRCKTNIRDFEHLIWTRFSYH